MLMLDLRECGILNVAEVDTKIHRGMLFGSINPGDFTEAVVCVCAQMPAGALLASPAFWP